MLLFILPEKLVRNNVINVRIQIHKSIGYHLSIGRKYTTVYFKFICNLSSSDYTPDECDHLLNTNDLINNDDALKYDIDANNDSEQRYEDEQPYMVSTSK